VTPPDWFELVSKGGAYVSPLLLAAILWLNAERNRLLGELTLKAADLKEANDKVESLSERILVVTTELKTWLFSEQRGRA